MSILRTISVTSLVAFAACTDTGANDGGVPLGAGGAGAAGAPVVVGSGGTSAGTAGASGATSAGGGAGAATAGSGGGSGTAGRGGSAGSAATAGSGGEAAGAAGVGGTSGAASGGVGAEGGDDGTGGVSDPGGLTEFELVVIGSSTAAGEGASSSTLGWVSLLGRALDDATDADVTTTNLARGGYTTVELASGSGADGNIDDAVDRQPNLILVSLAGSNDLSAGTSGATFLARLSELRDAANEAEIPVFFLSTAPKDLSSLEREALRDWAEQMGAAFDSCWVPDRTDDYSPCFVDTFSPLANDELGIDEAFGSGDGIHLNDAGHEAIFEATRTVVTPYVCSLVDCG